MMIEIRGLDETPQRSLCRLAERRLHFALSRFGERVQRVLVRLEDLNGPRGGLDQRCQIEAQVSGVGWLIVEVTDVEPEPAISRAAERLARRIRETLAVQRNAQRRAGALRQSA